MSHCLLLNANASPVNVLPLSVVDWQEAIRYMVLDKASVVSWHENWIVRSANWSTPVPAILMLREYQKPKTTVRFSKANVFLRDEHKCQYCGIGLQKKDCTLDHVIPTSKGGKSTFENSVTACFTCNSKKGHHTHIKPMIKPYRPTYYELVNKRKKFAFHVGHESWMDYLQ